MAPDHDAHVSGESVEELRTGLGELRGERAKEGRRSLAAAFRRGKKGKHVRIQVLFL